MRTEITEIKQPVAKVDAGRSRQSRVWSDGYRKSRTDAPILALTDSVVDAVFEQHDSTEIVASSQADCTSDDHGNAVAGLTAQLTLLERQCTHLRQMLEQANKQGR